MINVIAAAQPTIVSLSPNDGVLRPLNGSDSMLTAVASGTEPITYEWFSTRSTLSPFATGPILDLDPITSNTSITLRVSNIDGATESDPITVRPYYRQPPEFTRTPRDFALTLGEPFTINIGWQGSLPLTIAWLKNGEIIQSGPSSSFHIDAASASDGGIYTIRLTNAFGVRERHVEVTPIPPPEPQSPQIIRQPENMEEEVDDSYYKRINQLVGASSESEAASDNFVILNPSIFTLVKASGSPPMTFELVREGAVISQTTVTVADENGSILGQIFHPLITPDSFGDYFVRVRNSVGSVESNGFQMRRRPLTAPYLASSLRPNDMTIPPGSNLNWFTLIGGSPPLSIQWFKDGQTLSGATHQSLSINNIKDTDAGFYTLEVEGPGGRMTTQPARVTVGSPPPSAPQFNNLNPTQLEFTSHVPATLYFNYSFTGTTPMTFSWRHEGSELINETNPWLELTGEASEVVGNYYLTATNAHGTTNAHVAIVEEVAGAPPQIVQEPASIVPLEVGENLELNLEVEGNPTPAFQWFKDSQEINFSTNANFSIYRITSAGRGTYHLEASNRFGTARSRDFVVTVDASFPPEILLHPDSFHNSEDQPGGALSVHHRNPQGAAYQWFRDGEVIERQTQSYYFSSISPLSAGTYTVEITQNGQTVTSAPAVITTGETVSPIIFSTGGKLVRTDTSPQLSTLGSSNHALLAIRTTDVPTSVTWKRDEKIVPNQTDMSLWSDAWDGRAGSYTATVTTSQGTFTSPPMRLEHYREETLPVIRTQPKSQSVGIGEFGYMGPRLSIEFSSPSPPEIQWFHNDEAIPGALESTYIFSSFQEANTGNYFARITTPLGTIDSEVAYMDTLPLELPTIVRQPHGLTVTNPSSQFSQISLEVTSPHQVSYAWYLDGTLLPDGTESWIYLPSDTSFAPATIQVAVSSAAGTVWSETAEILLDDRPIGPDSIVAPADQSVGPGASITLAPSITNAPGPLAYQWFHNGERIEGATSITLSLENLSPSDAGEYTVSISTGSFSFTTPSTTVEITNAYSPLRGRHRILGNGIIDGEPIRIQTRLEHSGNLQNGTYSLLLPTGWSLVTENTTGTSFAPAHGQINLLEWRWDEVPASPIEFQFTLSAPAEISGTDELAALLESRMDSLDFQALARPDPLILRYLPNHHTADTDQNGKLSLSELLRVIELYNTRNGSTRTGRYNLSDITDDGFAPDPTQAVTTESTIPRIHLADTDWDGALSLSELLRVIELYNTRTGTARTGAYHRATGTTDGFEPSIGE